MLRYLVILVSFGIAPSLLSQKKEGLRIVHVFYEEYEGPEAGVSSFLLLGKQDSLKNFQSVFLTDEIQDRNSIVITPLKRIEKKLFRQLNTQKAKIINRINCENGYLEIRVWLVDCLFEFDLSHGLNNLIISEVGKFSSVFPNAREVSIILEKLESNPNSLFLN